MKRTRLEVIKPCRPTVACYLFKDLGSSMTFYHAELKSAEIGSNKQILSRYKPNINTEL